MMTRETLRELLLDFYATRPPKTAARKLTQLLDAYHPSPILDGNAPPLRKRAPTRKAASRTA